MPVTGVELYVNGIPFYSAGSISEVYFQYSPVTMAAGCADIIDVEMVAMNLVGLEAHVTATVDTSEHDTIIE